MAQFEIYVGQDAKHHWRLRAANHEIVCWSEGYNTRQGAENSVNWTKVNAPNASIK